MFRSPGNTMTAVEIVSAMYDGPIPADVMMQARAEDSAYKADPDRFNADAARSGIEWNTRCARASITRIREFISDGETLSAESERKQILAAHLAARRQYQAEVRQITKGVN